MTHARRVPRQLEPGPDVRLTLMPIDAGTPRRRTVDDDAGLVSDHLADLAVRNLRSTTITQRRLAVARFRRYLGERRGLLEATTQDLVDHVSRPLSPEGRATEISHLRGFYRWLFDTGYLLANPAERLKRPKLPRRLPRPMGSTDLAYCIHMADERVRPWLLLAGYAGLRCAEISQLRREDVLAHNDPPLILVVDGKGARQRLVPIADELLAEYEQWPKPVSGWLFPRWDGQPGPMPPHMISRYGARELRLCGIDATMHQARHLFGTTLYAKTKDIRLVQEVLGHSSPTTTAGYAAWSPADAAAAIAGLRYDQPKTRPKPRRRAAS